VESILHRCPELQRVKHVAVELELLEFHLRQQHQLEPKHHDGDNQWKSEYDRLDQPELEHRHEQHVQLAVDVVDPDRLDLFDHLVAEQHQLREHPEFLVPQHEQLEQYLAFVLDCEHIDAVVERYRDEQLSEHVELLLDFAEQQQHRCNVE
jgi:hypothetical protein